MQSIKQPNRQLAVCGLRARTTASIPSSACCNFYRKHPQLACRRSPRRLARWRRGPVLRGPIAEWSSVVGVVFSTRRWMWIPCGRMLNMVVRVENDARPGCCEKRLSSAAPCELHRFRPCTGAVVPGESSTAAAYRCRCKADVKVTISSFPSMDLWRWIANWIHNIWSKLSARAIEKKLTMPDEFVSRALGGVLQCVCACHGSVLLRGGTLV
jgi:hypothetical protein